MKNAIKLTGICFLVLYLLVLGCGKETTDPEPETDSEAIDWLINENPRYFNSENHYGDEDTTGGKMGICTPIITYFWYRELDTEPTIHVEVDIVGDSAFVSWTGEFDGILHLFSSDTFPPDTILEYTKDFLDLGTRYAVFKRVCTPEEDPYRRRGWRLVAVSGGEIVSAENTVVIDSVRLNSESYPDTLFTDPLAIFAREDIVTLLPEERCSLTVYTNSDTVDVDYVFLHSWRRNIKHHRHRFAYVGNGTFTGVWFAPSHTEGAVDIVHHVAFDMLDKETLDDDVSPYDANAWLFPYLVTGSY
jgi:hypothetical protein